MRESCFVQFALRAQRNSLFHLRLQLTHRGAERSEVRVKTFSDEELMLVLIPIDAFLDHRFVVLALVLNRLVCISANAYAYAYSNANANAYAYARHYLKLFRELSMQRCLVRASMGVDDCNDCTELAQHLIEHHKVLKRSTCCYKAFCETIDIRNRNEAAILSRFSESNKTTSPLTLNSVRSLLSFTNDSTMSCFVLITSTSTEGCLIVLASLSASASKRLLHQHARAHCSLAVIEQIEQV